MSQENKQDIEETSLEEVILDEENAEDTDLDSNKKKKTKKKNKPTKKQKIITNIILVVAIIVFLVSGYMLFTSLWEYKKAADEYNDIKNEFVIEEPDDESGNEIKVDLSALKAINDDVTGWIHFENLPIDYPIVQGRNNDEYLIKSFRGEWYRTGSIFLDFRNTKDMSDRNNIIYGHNMKDLSMFGRLREYLDENFYKKEGNEGFYIYDDKGWHYYEIFSVYRCDLVKSIGGKPNPDYQAEIYWQFNFKDDADFKAFADKVKARSIYDTGVKVKDTDRTVMLSTCTTDDNHRLVLHAVKVADKAPTKKG